MFDTASSPIGQRLYSSIKDDVRAGDPVLVPWSVSSRRDATWPHVGRRLRGFAKTMASSFLLALLAAGLLLSCFFLAAHAFGAPQLDYLVAGELLLVAVLSVEGIVAVRHLRQARLESVHQVLMAILHDFRSPEMLLAINALWRFRHEQGDRFVEAYLERWRKDNERIAALPEGEQLEAMRATLHCRRRIVKEFYNLLAGLYELGVLPKAILYTYWSEAELNIIPEILIPLELAVARELRMETAPGDWLRRLRRLHDDRYA